jgi:hypothetical protein
VGAEPHRSLADQLASRFDDLATAAGRSIAWNARAAGPAAVDRVAAEHPWVERAMIEIVRRSIRAVFGSVRSQQRWPRAALVTAVAAAVTAIVVGFALNGWALAAGVGVGVALAGIPAGYVAVQISRVRRYARVSTPEEVRRDLARLAPQQRVAVNAAVRHGREIEVTNASAEESAVLAALTADYAGTLGVQERTHLVRALTAMATVALIMGVEVIVSRTDWPLLWAGAVALALLAALAAKSVRTLRRLRRTKERNETSNSRTQEPTL